MLRDNKVASNCYHRLSNFFMIDNVAVVITFQYLCEFLAQSSKIVEHSSQVHPLCPGFLFVFVEGESQPIWCRKVNWLVSR